MSEEDLAQAAIMKEALVDLTRFGMEMTIALNRIKKNAMDMGMSEEVADRLCVYVLDNLKEELP